jgi:uncharacterized protein YecE (DUF72 family)
MAITDIRLGCAGWSLPRASWPAFPAEGSHLERYAARFNAVEINSSFYRPHQSTTYARWAAAVPDGFRFAVKLPKTLTHEQRLANCEPLMDAFVSQAAGLGHKLGCLLVQLPPSLALDASRAEAFLGALRQRHHGHIALEARHASWFTAGADALLASQRVGRVLADPVLFDAGRWPGGDAATVYLRLHGSPRMYYSAYARPLLQALAVRLHLAAASDAAVWCIFDNTASGAAVDDALFLQQEMRGR